MIKHARLAFAILLLAPAAAFAQQDTIVIRAATILDGKGGVLRDTRHRDPGLEDRADRSESRGHRHLRSEDG